MQVVIVSSVTATAKLVDALRSFGIKAQLCGDCANASAFIDAFKADLALIDVGLAGCGSSELATLRITHKTLPIIVVGADIAREHVLSSLSAGADDVLRWPSDPEIMAARIRVIVRRCRGADASVLEIGPMRFDMIHRSLQIDDLPVTLTNKEYGVLEYMLTHKGAVLTKNTLLDQLYGGRDAPDARIIDVFVCKLRRKLADHGVHQLIETVRGLGYMVNERDCRFVQTTFGSDGSMFEATQVA